MSEINLAFPQYHFLSKVELYFHLVSRCFSSANNFHACWRDSELAPAVLLRSCIASPHI